MPSPTAEPSCFVDPDRTSPAAKTPGIEVSIVALETRNPPASRSTAPARISGVRLETDEDKRGRRRIAVGLAAVAVACDDGGESSTLTLQRDDVHTGEDRELWIGAYAVLENRRGRQIGAREDSHPVGELRQVQSLLKG